MQRVYENIVIRRSRITASDLVLSTWEEHNVRTVTEAREAISGHYIREDFFNELWNRYQKGGATTMGNRASDQKNSRCFSLKLSRNTDKELIEHLEKQDNIQAYIKQLIREDIKRTSR